MDFTSIFLILISCAGVTWTFVQSTIMDKIGLRPLWERSPFLKSLMNCEFCFGFHVGWSYGIFCYWLLAIHSFWFYVLTIPFASACASFIFGKSLCVLIELNELLENKNKEK